MSTAERNSGGERQDPLVQTRKIVNLVLQVPHPSQVTDIVLEAVGCVLADLYVLDRHQGLMRQLGNGVTTEDVDIAREQILQAASMRPIDKVAAEQRLIVLAGLSRIRAATEFNERVAQSPTDGIAIFQVGLTSGFVEQAVQHVLEAQRLVLEAPRPIQKPEPEAEVTLSSLDPIESDAKGDDVDTEDRDTPIFSSPDDPIYGQARADAFVDQPGTSAPASKVQEAPKRTRRINRRDLFRLAKTSGIVGGGLIFAGEASGKAPVFEWLADLYEYNKPSEQRIAEHEAYIQKYSLSETARPSIGLWEVSYPKLADDEEFKSIFINSYRQISNGNNTPIYELIGEKSPLLIDTPNVGFKIYASRYHGTFPIVDYYPSGNSGGWFILTGRKTPKSPELRNFPEVVQLRNTNTEAIYYLEVKPIKTKERDRTEKDVIELRYMKKVKKNILPALS